MNNINIMELKSFFNYLLEKYWKLYGEEIIGLGFGPYKDDIQKEIRQYLDENILYSFNKEDYQNDSDEYVKYIAYQELKNIFGNELLYRVNRNYPNPKRFKKSVPPRD